MVSQSYPSPRDYEPVPDELYRNNGDGTFTDVSVRSGIAAQAGRSMGMTAADYDNDGDTDLFICNDVQPNFLLQNDGQGSIRGSRQVGRCGLQRQRPGTGQHGRRRGRLQQ